MARAVFEALETRQLLCVDHPLHDGEFLISRSATLPAKSSGPQVYASGPSSPTVPALSSRPEASAKLFLDFDGAPSMAWGSFTAAATPRYDIDNNTTTFSATELANIQNIFNRVAELFSPFNIDVTTIDPGSYNNGQALRAVVGGNGSWYGSAGGVAYVGGFTNSASNTVFIFPKMLANGDVKYTAEAIAHESGHGFGLYHQSKYSGSTKTAEYHSGTSAKAPIMGSSYSATRATWWYGQTTSATKYQDDVAVLASATNGFGYRPDDHGNTFLSATALTLDGNEASGSGVIETKTDTDFFSFSTLAGTVSFTVSRNSYAGMLDARLTLLDSSGTVITTANTSNLNESIELNLNAGQYFVVVGSAGNAGDIGQFTLSGTIVTSPDFVAAPKNLVAISSNGQANLTWTDMSWNETGFVIQRSNDGGNSWEDIGANDPNDFTFTDSTVQAGNSYSYRIYATGPVEDSGFSPSATVNVTPATVTGLSFSNISANALTLTWNDVGGETGYRIERSTNGTSWSQIAIIAADTTSYENTGLTAGARYYYRVKATSAVGDSAVSASANSYTLCVAPTTLTGTPTVNSISLGWTNITGETGYRIERSLDGNTWTQIGTTAKDKVALNVTALTANTTYYFRVRSINSAGDSAPTSTLTKVTLLPAPASLTAAGSGTETVNLSWPDSTGEVGYKLERQSGSSWIATVLPADETSTSISGLKPGTSYSFRIRAINAGGSSAATKTFVATTAPAAPTLSVTALSTSSIKLTWGNVAANKGYKIERSSNGVDWSQIGTTLTNVVTYTDGSLSTDTVYYYRVRGTNAAGDGLYSTGKFTTTPLNAPTGLSATPFSSTQVNLSWTDSQTETGYRIERLSGKTWVKVVDLNADASSYSVLGLPAGTTSSFRIRAKNAGGLSLPSGTSAALTLPAKAATPALTVLGHNSIKLTWGKVTGAGGYEVDRSADGSSWAKIGNTAATVVAFTDTGLTQDTLYYYRVRATNASGNGAYSNSTFKRTVLPSPTNVAGVANSATQATITWQDQAGELGYKLERKTGTKWALVANMPADTTSRVVTGLAGGTTYSFRVSALSTGGASVPSAVNVLTKPAATTTLKASPIAGGVKLTWTNVTGESGYVLQRSTDGSTWGDLIALGANVYTYSNKALSAGTYYYRVIAINASGQSTFSPTAIRTI